MALLLSLLALLLWHTPSQAQGALLAWDYPRTEQPEAFLLTATRGSQHQTWRTTPSAVGDCAGVTHPDVYCTRIPQCPAPGAVAFRIAALQDGSVLASQDAPLSCQVVSQTPCQVTCQHMPAGPAPVSGGTVAQIPGAEEAPAILSDTPDTNGQVPLTIPVIPTRDTAVLPGAGQYTGPANVSTGGLTSPHMTLTRGTVGALAPLLLLSLVRAALAQPTCDASQFNDRAGIHVTRAQCQTIRGLLRPGDGSTFEGMQLEQVHLKDSTGVTLRANQIRSHSDGRTVLITGTTRQLRLEANTITTTTTHNEHAHTILIADAHGTDVVLRGNRLSNTSPGGEDLLQMVRWSGTWLITQNVFGANAAEDHIDIKGTAPGTTGRVVIRGNVFDGAKLGGSGGCILLHGERLPGEAAWAYTAEVTGNTFVRCRKALYHRISRGQTAGDPEGRTLLMHDNAIQGGLVVLESENATLHNNVFGASARLQMGDNGYIPRKVSLTGNTFTTGAAPAPQGGGDTPTSPAPAPRNLRLLQP